MEGLSLSFGLGQMLWPELQLSEQESEYLNHHLHSAVKTKFVTIILYDSCL